MTAVVKFLLIICLAVLAGLAGLNLPDVDQRVAWSWLIHRSILTHSPLIPLAVYIGVAIVGKPQVFRLPAMYLSLGFAVHLAFDLFPKEWIGFALIRLPCCYEGPLPTPASILLIGGGMLICAVIAARLIRSFADAVLFVCGAAAIFFIASRSEDTLLWPLVSMLIALIVSGALALLTAGKRPQTSPPRGAI